LRQLEENLLDCQEKLKQSIDENNRLKSGEIEIKKEHEKLKKHNKILLKK
jgi:hypothetical protein